jgi:hypothetical protein
MNENNIGFNEMIKFNLNSYVELKDINEKYPFQESIKKRLTWMLFNREYLFDVIRKYEEKLMKDSIKLISIFNLHMERDNFIVGNREIKGYLLKRITINQFYKKVKEDFEFWDSYVLIDKDIKTIKRYIILKPFLNAFFNNNDIEWCVSENPFKYPAMKLEEWIDYCSKEDIGIIIEPLTPYDIFLRKKYLK